MSASRVKKERQTSTVGLTEKEKQALLDAKSAKRKKVLYSVLGVVAVLAVAALLVWDNGVVQRHLTAVTVGDNKYTAADVDYYFFTEYNNYYSSYGSLGLFEEGVSLKDQVATTDDDGNDVSWYDAIRTDAVNTLVNVSNLYDEAMAAGYQLSEDGQATIDSALESITAVCSTYSITEAYYFQQTYGQYMTKNRFIKDLTMYTTAQEYAEKLQTDYQDSYTDDEITAYYDENSADLDTYYYELYYVDGAAESTTDDEGNTVAATDEETAAAMSAASEVADQLVTALDAADADAVDALLADAENGASLSGSYATIGSALSSTYADWVKDDARVEGDVTFMEATSGYYVVHFQRSELDEYHPANYHTLTVTAELDDEATTPTAEQLSAAETAAQELLDSAADEDAFLALTSGDATVSTSNSVTKAATTDEELYAWLFDEERVAGDTTILELSDGTGYQLIWFTGYDDRSLWQETVVSTKASEDYTAWYEGIEANYATSEGVGLNLVGEGAGE